MQAILFVGIQASGKSSFFMQRFVRSHVLVSLDVVRTRHRERQMVELCLSLGQPFVVDNTNPSVRDRARYVPRCKAAGFEVAGYYFQSAIEPCLARNRQRAIELRVPDVALRSCRSRLELPSYAEGFDSLFYVQLTSQGFRQEAWTI